MKASLVQILEDGLKDCRFDTATIERMTAHLKHTVPDSIVPFYDKKQASKKRARIKRLYSRFAEDPELKAEMAQVWEDFEVLFKNRN